MTRRIVFGGSFDPVHLGHLAVAEFALGEAAAESLVFLPAGRSPRRESAHATFEQRRRMLELSLRRTSFLMDPREGGRPGPSFTVDTLEELETAQAERTYLLIGADQLSCFRSWMRWERVLELVDLLVINRPGWHSPENAVPHRVLEWPGWGISSTWIRGRIAAGRDCRHLLPDGVWDFVKEQGLYGWKGA